jgi:hypothetical protein
MRMEAILAPNRGFVAMNVVAGREQARLRGRGAADAEG